MSEDPNFVYTRLGTDGDGKLQGFYVEIGEGSSAERYDIVQLNMVRAVNEIPTARLLLGTGRPFNSGNQGVSRNQKLVDAWKSMTPAKVWLGMSGDFAPGIPWPKPDKPIFDGYLAGVSVDGGNDQIAASVELIDWSVDLTFSTCTVEGLMPASLGALAEPLTLNMLSRGLGILPSYTSVAGIGAAITPLAMQQDVWGSIKTVFAELSKQKLIFRELAAVAGAPGSVNPASVVGALGGAAAGAVTDVNTRAQKALKRIEGKIGSRSEPTDFDYKYAVPTKLDSEIVGVQGVAQALVYGLGRQATSSYLGSSFWDKAVQEMFPALGLAYVPMVSRGLVIADTPMYSKGPWRTLRTDEYTEIRQPRELSKPLRGVAVVVPGTAGSPSFNNLVSNGFGVIGGYQSSDSVSDSDGHVMFVPPPPWMAYLNVEERSFFGGGGRLGEGLTKYPGVRGFVGPPPPPFLPYEKRQFLYKRWAQHVFALNSLRGSSGVIVGKLRFDIAPGSGIVLEKKAESFLGVNDSLAGTMWANVVRVSHTIDCENRVAATTFQLSYARTDAENGTVRGGVKTNPLYGDSIHGNGKGGAPLIEGHENLES